MANFFSELLQGAIGNIDSLKVSEQQEVIRYEGAKGKLFAFNHVYADGMEVLLLRGRIINPFVISKREVVETEHLICSLVINVHQLTYYYDNGMQSQISQRDVSALHNKHAGFEVAFEPNTDFFILSIRLFGKAYVENKAFIFKHLTHVNNENEQVLFFKDFISPESSKLIGDIDKKLNMPDGFFVLYLKAKAQEAFVLSLYEMTVSHSTLLKYSIAPDKLALANTIRNLIHEDLTNHLTVKSISQEVGASETLVKNVFQRVYGVPIYTFYQNRRLARAMQLLQDQKNTIVDVAYELGFSTPSNFAKFFKAKMGLSPREYLSKNKKGKTNTGDR